ncbi:MAG: LAGLIDADG family homing endonuclease [Candidatus Diapherotrites archaeon]
MLRESFSLSRIPEEAKTKMLQLIKDGSSLNKIAKETGLPKTTIYYYFRKLRGRTYFEPEFDLNYSGLEGEIVGIFAGDGSQYHDTKRGHYEVNVHFGKTDYVYYVKDLFGKYFNKKFNLLSESRERFRLRTNSKKISNHFKNYLEYDPKIKHCTVGLKKLNFSEGFLIGFLRGFLDTDGTVCRAADGNIKIVYCTTSKKLAYQIKEILDGFDIICSLRVIIRSGFKDIYHIYLWKRSVKPFLQLVKPYKRKRVGLLV